MGVVLLLPGTPQQDNSHTLNGETHENWKKLN